MSFTFTVSSHPPSLLSHSSLIYPSASNPSPSNNHPVFTDAMAIRHAVFVDEQCCSADAEIDADDARSWEFVVYAHPTPTTTTTTPPSEVEDRGRPVGVVRLVPPPHAPHETLHYPDRAAEHDKFDVRHEPYVKVTRVAVVREFRGYGISRKLMEVLEDWARRNRERVEEMMEYVLREDGGVGGRRWNGLIGLHAQVQVEKMYARLGYETDMAMGRWDEEGIEHVGMFKRVSL
ncbi:acyl-CoA N-acyltransferase, partial [Talaromyces proteolyticus]